MPSRKRKHTRIEEVVHLHHQHHANHLPHMQTRGVIDGLASLSRGQGEEPRTDHYILRWLEQTRGQNKTDSGGGRQKDRCHKNPAEQPEYGPAFRVQCKAPINVRLETKPWHQATSDSSILAVPRRTLAASPTRAPPNDKSRRNQQQKSREQPDVDSLNRKMGQSASPQKEPRRETFGKRARHKTREDRYEPKQSTNRVDIQEKPSPKRKRQKKGDRDRAAKKTGADLIRKFSSNNIGQERLTMRPNIGLGLCKSGRASSPVKPRGLPDLAFSDMDFLQRANRRATVEDDRVGSKWRDAEAPKYLKSHYDISAFFKPSRGVLQSISANDRSMSSLVPESEPHSRSAVGLGIDEAHHDNRGYVVHQEQHLGDVRQRNGSKSLYMAQTSHNQTQDTLQTQISGSAWSGRVASFVTCFEAQKSLTLAEAKPTRQQHYDEEQRLTPDSVRRQLEETGIFRYTGIRKHTTLQHQYTSESLFGICGAVKQDSGDLLYNEHSPRRASPSNISEAPKAEVGQADFAFSPCPSLRSAFRKRLRRLQGEEGEADDMLSHIQPTKGHKPLVNVLTGAPALQITQDQGLRFEGEQGIQCAAPNGLHHRTQGTGISHLNCAQDRPLSREQIVKDVRLSYPAVTETAAKKPESRKAKQLASTQTLAGICVQGTCTVDDAVKRSLVTEQKIPNPSQTEDTRVLLGSVQAVAAEQYQMNQNLQLKAAVNIDKVNNSIYSWGTAQETLQRPPNVSRPFGAHDIGNTQSHAHQIRSRIFESMGNAFEYGVTPRNYWMNRTVQYTPQPSYGSPFAGSEPLRRHGYEQTSYNQEMFLQEQRDDQVYGGTLHSRHDNSLYAQYHEPYLSKDPEHVEEAWRSQDRDSIEPDLNENYHNSEFYAEQAEIPNSDSQFEMRELSNFEPWDDTPHNPYEHRQYFGNEAEKYNSLEALRPNLEHTDLCATTEENIDMKWFWRSYRQY